MLVCNHLRPKKSQITTPSTTRFCKISSKAWPGERSALLSATQPTLSVDTNWSIKSASCQSTRTTAMTRRCNCWAVYLLKAHLVSSPPASFSANKTTIRIRCLKHNVRVLLEIGEIASIVQLSCFTRLTDNSSRVKQRNPPLCHRRPYWRNVPLMQAARAIMTAAPMRAGKRQIQAWKAMNRWVSSSFYPWYALPALIRYRHRQWDTTLMRLHRHRHHIPQMKRYALV